MAISTPTYKSSRTRNGYLIGPFAPVTEEREENNLTVEGEIPSVLNGTFFRNGPNPQFEPLGRYHWFDGDGMIHSVKLENGQATYRNRYVRTADFETEKKAEKSLWRGILDPFDASLKNPDKNTANTDLVFFHGKLIATWYLSGTPYELDAELNNLGPCDFGGSLGNHGFAAHPKLDPDTNELMFIDHDVYNAPYLQYGVVSPEGKVNHFTEIEMPGARIFHDIGITPNYTLIPDCPLVWHSEKLKKGKRVATFDQDLPTRFAIIPRKGDGRAVRWFEAEPCYIFHIINSYEAGDELILHGCKLADPIPKTRHNHEGVVPRLQFMQLNPFLHEWRFNLKTGQTTERQLDDRATEFPRMNNDYIGKSFRYSYHPKIAQAPELLFEGIIKYDLESGASKEFYYGKGRFGGEVVFAKDPNGNEEDDGWLTTFVYDTNNDSSEFVIIEAKSLQQVAAAKIKSRVPAGFHAWWAETV